MIKMIIFLLVGILSCSSSWAEEHGHDKHEQHDERDALDGAAQHGDAAVYIFTVDDDFDLDGNLPWNIARLINHSCEPNCEAWIDKHRIFIHALCDIKQGEELSFDYGFDIETWEDHPCRCGKKSCVGHIVSRSQWKELEKKKAEKHALSKKASKKIPAAKKSR